VAVAIAAVQVFDRVVVMPRDAREASDVFYRQVIGLLDGGCDNSTPTGTHAGLVSRSQFA
jgi:hypothetical protein